MCTRRRQQKPDSNPRKPQNGSPSGLPLPMHEHIHILVTGGTIDSIFKAEVDTVVPRKKSILRDYLRNVKPYFDFTITQICMKDSRHLTDADRRKLLQAITESKFAKIMVTHGTYTMPDTARYLSVNLPDDHNKTIILTGSMIPIDGFTMSDGPFNLGFAIASMAYLDYGIYVCMNGRIFTPDEVIKQLDVGRFVSVFGEK